jgi:hypothetical protein
MFRRPLLFFYLALFLPIFDQTSLRAQDVGDVVFDTRSDSAFGDATAALREFLRDQNVRSRRDQHFCIAGYRSANGEDSRAWIHWAEGRKIILWRGASDPRSAKTSIARSHSILDLNKLEDAQVAMLWMRVVVENRLAKPSPVWGSAGAKTLKDVIQAKNQFEGFSKYPTIAQGPQKVIDQAVSIANNGDDPRRSKYKEFLDTALTVAAQKTVTDPSAKGLYWWRTSGSGKPTPEATVYMTKLGNTFYTL